MVGDDDEAKVDKVFRGRFTGLHGERLDEMIAENFKKSALELLRAGGGMPCMTG